jgi:hypothetical protein
LGPWATANYCRAGIRSLRGTKTFMIEDFFQLLPVSTTTVVHLELRISPRIFKKIWNGSNGILRAWGKLIHEKNQKSKISWHCPFNMWQLWILFLWFVSNKLSLHITKIFLQKWLLSSSIKGLLKQNHFVTHLFSDALAAPCFCVQLLQDAPFCSSIVTTSLALGHDPKVYTVLKIKGTVSRNFSTSGFFHESVSPKPLSIPLGLFRIFSKIRGDIHSSRCTTGVVDIGGKWQKSSIIKVLIILFGHL